MIVKTFADRLSMSRAAAEQAAHLLRSTIVARGEARIIAATGASQFDFLEALTSAPDVDWTRVEMFHLDEYVGLSEDHPASFRKYLRERLIERTGIRRYHFLDAEHEPAEVAARVGAELAQAPVDAAFVGIGENGHLAFNDPPADFDTEAPYIVVTLDDACRQQQVGEGWFRSVEEVPSRALSMSVRQILKSREIICVVPDARKAAAVRASLEGEITPQVPASILRTHPRVTVYLDADSAAMLRHGTRGPILPGPSA